MDQKLPYYMAYPMTLDFDEDRAERMDFEYLKSMYPEIPKKILPYVEEECDRMAYDNSMIYDQYPDRLQLRLMSARICDNVKKHEKMLCAESLTGVLADMGRDTSDRYGNRENKERRKPEREDSWLRDLVDVMLYQELFRRRRERRRTSRKFY